MLGIYNPNNDFFVTTTCFHVTVTRFSPSIDFSNKKKICNLVKQKNTISCEMTCKMFDFNDKLKEISPCMCEIPVRCLILMINKK